MFSRRTTWKLHPNRFSITLERLRAEKRTLLDLTASNPTVCGFHYDKTEILRALSGPQGLQYSPESQGMRSARAAVAQYYAELPSAPTVSPDAIFLTTSTSEAYSYAFRLLCDPGDEVMIPRPGYPLFDLLAEIQDVELVPYPLIYDLGWQVDEHSLESAITERTRAVIVVHPNNPTGSTVSPGEMQALAEICAKRELAIIADEVFLDYVFAGDARSFAENAKCLTLTLSGLSKISGLPQMKVAWMVVSGPDALKRDAISRLDVIADTYLSINTPMQVAMPALLKSRTEFQRQLRARLQTNLCALDKQLGAYPHCQRLEIQAGWYVTLRVPANRSDEELAIALMEQQGVVVHPGHFFDFPADGHLIISLMTPEEDFREGMRRILTSVA